MELDDYFAEDKIIRQLCKERIKSAKSAHERQDLSRFVGGRQVGASRPFINTILPPRKVWALYRPPHRSRVSDVDFASLVHATLALIHSQPEVPWAINLRRVIERIRERARSEGRFAFERPRITWEVKEGNKYRPLARFSLEDNVINSLSARYFRDFCDSAFEPTSYAFRSRTDQGLMPTHHGAFEEIRQLKKAAGCDLFVAEADIRAFYDAVGHDAAMEGAERTIERAQLLRPGRRFHARAMQIFEAYLNCYSFPESVLEEALPLLRREDRNAEFPWPEKELAAYYTSPRTEAIGVPQGGALSCIIANLVLDRADKAVRMVVERLGPDVHYFRYCDDMIVLARRESHCRETFDVYRAALKESRLPYHQPVTVEVYDKNFWKAKSKNPYRWTGRKGYGCVPWIQFVGYQIRYDGLVRIKAKSVIKQLRKIRNTADHVKFGIKHELERTGAERILASKKQLVLSFAWKLTYSAVGRVNLKQQRPGPRPMCWAGGYKALNGKPLVSSFLKRLDRFREKQLLRIDQAEIPYGPGMRPKQQRRGKRPLPSGYPFSYLAQFDNQGGQFLIDHPYRPWFQRYIRRPLYLLAHCPKRLLRKVKQLGLRIGVWSASLSNIDNV